MSIHIAQTRRKLHIGNKRVKKAYKGANLVYSAGNSVTYHVDTNVTYQEEINEGESCLSPKTFIPVKSGWTFVGWRQDTIAPATGSVESSVPMGDVPVTLYAVFRQVVSVTYYNENTAKKTSSKNRYYNNGNIVNPSFALTQAGLSGWTARGWSTGTAANGGIIYGNGASFTRDSNITLYGMYQQVVTVTYYNGSTSASSTSGIRYYCPGSGSVINPGFTLTQAGISGWAARGWSTGTGATAGITYSNGASFTRDTNCILYGMYYQTITLTTYNGSSSATTHGGTRYYCPGSGSVVNPTFTVSPAALSGWSFNGWCTSSGAAAGISYSSISGLELAANLTLYGRYSQTITLSYNGNSASGGSVATQYGTRYWNSGNVANPTFTLQANGFTRSGYNFTAWALNGGTQYTAGASVTLAASATMYAVWQLAAFYAIQNGVPNYTYMPGPALQYPPGAYSGGAGIFDASSGIGGAPFYGVVGHNTGSQPESYQFYAKTGSINTNGFRKMRVIFVNSTHGQDNTRYVEIEVLGNGSRIWNSYMGPHLPNWVSFTTEYGFRGVATLEFDVSAYSTVGACIWAGNSGNYWMEIGIREIYLFI